MTPATLLPGVSIIVPAYNEEAVLERCIEAAIDQTVAAHEIIVVDNRSTDRTARIARSFADSSAVPVRLVGQHRTQGLIPTRNAGFDAATGAVLGRIDADSLVERDWVAWWMILHAAPCAVWEASTRSSTAATWPSGHLRGERSRPMRVRTPAIGSTRTSISPSICTRPV